MRTTPLPKHSSGDPKRHTPFYIVTIGPLTLWFSYETLIAFHLKGFTRVIHTNDWGPTTGKHLNRIDNKAHFFRVSDALFKQLWHQQTDALFDLHRLAAYYSKDAETPPISVKLSGTT